MKICFIIDSSAGLTKDEAEKRGWGFLPLYLTINGKDYSDGIDIDSNMFYKMININMNVRTSSTPPAQIMDILNEKLKNYDQIIVYALSTHLSSQTNNIFTFAKEYPNVHVINSHGVGNAIVKDVEELEEMAKNNMSIEDIVSKGNEITLKEYGVIMPNTMSWLIKGGRVSPAAAAMGNMLKIIPQISFINGKLEKYGKGRIFKKTIIKATISLKKELGENVKEWIIYHGNNIDLKEYKEIIENILKTNVTTAFIPPVIGSHVGPGSIGIFARKS